MSLIPNATTLEAAMETAMAVPGLPVPLRDLWDPETCPEALLPWLAWGLSVDDWDATWPLAVRRQVVARAIEIQRHKGTLSAVRSAVAAFGGAISIREWWETVPEGEAGTFDMVLALAEVEGATPTSAYIDAVVRQVYQTKPLSRHFTFTLAINAAGRIGLIAVARPTVSARLNFTA